jgi:cell division protein FtsL
MARATTAGRTLKPAILEIQSIRIRRDLKDTGFFYKAVVVVAFVGLLFFVYLQMRLTTVRMGYDISNANTERAILVDKNNRLKLEQARLMAPQRIEKIATEELGLSYPVARQIKRLK